MYAAPVDEAKVAAVRRRELVLKGGAPMESDSGRLSDCRNVLSYLALLVEGAVGARLVVTSHDGRIGHVHEFAGALVGEGERLCKHRLCRLILSLRLDLGG